MEELHVEDTTVEAATRHARSANPDVPFAEDTFTALYEIEYPRAVRLAHLLTGSNGAAEDIAQDVMIRLRGRLRDLRQPTAYITRSVTNACWNWHRGRRRQEERLRRSVPISAVVDPPEVDELLALVDRLPFRQRTVLVGRYWLDLPDAEIAELLGCRPTTVRTLAARALRTMKGQLA